MVNFSAVLVGINKYPDYPLKGCVNDIIIMRDILVRRYKIPANQIRLLIDERATKTSIEERLSWLVSNDSTNKLFYYSGHGAQIPVQDYSDKNYEPDNLDELLCPVDFNWDGTYITDNNIYDILCKMNPFHHMTMVFDCCHSGTATRDLNDLSNKSIPTPLDLLSRVSSISLADELDIDCEDLGLTEKGLFDLFKPTPDLMYSSPVFTELNISVLTGCADNQTSADAWFYTRHQGALSYYMQSILLRNPKISLEELRKECEIKLLKNEFDQTPQLICSEGNLKKPFIQI